MGDDSCNVEREEGDLFIFANYKESRERILPGKILQLSQFLFVSIQLTATPPIGVRVSQISGHNPHCRRKDVQIILFPLIPT